MDENTLYDLLTKALYHGGEKLVLYSALWRVVFENSKFLVLKNKEDIPDDSQDVPIGEHQNFIKLFKGCICFKHGSKYYTYNKEINLWVESDKYGN